MKIENDNLEPYTSEDGRVVMEPGYLRYLRSQGYILEGVKDVHTVPSESEKGKAYLVMTVETYEYPRNHPELDYAEHEYDLHVCTCWAFRSSSKDIGPGSGHKPDGDCKHIHAVHREEKAKQDDSQETLV